MKVKYLLPVLFLFALQMQAQDYLDLAKLSFNDATLGNVDNDRETSIANTYAEVYFPFPVSSKTTIIGGFTYENTRLGLGFTNDRTNLVMARLNLGVKQELGNNWSGTFVLLPKLASDFRDSSSENFQFGGLSLFEKRYTPRKGLKFGTYVSSEQFGTIITPLVGFWYRSKNSKFKVNAILPIRTEAQYAITERLDIGANLITSVKAYNLAQQDSQLYVQEESIRFNLFAGVQLIDDQLLLRGKVGFDTTDYGVYNQNDTVGAQILTIQLSGDDRTRLNSEFDSGLFLGFDLIFRMDI